jgi:ATP-dependent Clp protease adaptor protein ClpS
VMLQVHHEGKGVCGVYPHDIASSRVAQVAQYARARQHPLQCVLEPADDA